MKKLRSSVLGSFLQTNYVTTIVAVSLETLTMQEAIGSSSSVLKLGTLRS
jgi:hypothetical protein